MGIVKLNLQCKKVGLDRILYCPGHTGYPFVPQKGTTLTLEGENDPQLDGVYKVKKVHGNINVAPLSSWDKDILDIKGGMNQEGGMNQYIVELKKIK